MKPIQATALLLVVCAFLLVGCAPTTLDLPPAAPSPDIARGRGGLRTTVIVRSNAPNAVLRSPSGELVGNCPMEFFIQWDPDNYLAYWTNAKPDIVVWVKPDVGEYHRDWYVIGLVEAPGYSARDFKHHLARWNWSPYASREYINKQRAPLNGIVNIDVYLSPIVHPAAIPEMGEKKETEKGLVTVTSRPEDAEVILDGVFVGNAPCNLPLNEGIHIIEVRMSGHKVFRKEIRVPSGSTLNIKATLIPE
jgi:hypothetical protein